MANISTQQTVKIETCDNSVELKKRLQEQKRKALEAKKIRETLPIQRATSQGRKASEIERTPVYWLLHGWLPIGSVVMYTAKAGTGKTLLMCDYASHVSNGITWFTNEPCEQGNVLIVATEDVAENTLIPRLEDSGANMHNITILRDVMRDDVKVNGTQKEETLTLPIDMLRLEQEIKASHATLVILDPISKIFQNYTHLDFVRHKIMSPLSRMANELGVCIVLVNHPGKGKYHEDNIETWIGGARSIHDESRGSYVLTPDKTDSTIVNIQQVKNNLAEKQEMLSFRIVKDRTGKVYISYLPTQTMVQHKKMQASHSEIENIILAYLSLQSSPVSPSQITQDTNLNGATVRPTLGRLVQDGFIEKTSTGRYQISDYTLKQMGITRSTT